MSFTNNHFAHVFMKFCRIQNCMCIQVISLRHKLHCFCHTFRCFYQTFARRILSQANQCRLLYFSINSEVTCSSNCSIFLYPIIFDIIFIDSSIQLSHTSYFILLTSISYLLSSISFHRIFHKISISLV